jgi:hypothetical protein
LRLSCLRVKISGFLKQDFSGCPKIKIYTRILRTGFLRMSQGQDYLYKNPEDRISQDVPRSGYFQDSWEQDFSGSMKQIYQDLDP